ncbi:MAG TPA: hypothetical protein VG889_02765 [Rhizomicrobium sp.]|nr:hypothetical protein [Rhizomicrobium sp.]
MKRTTLLATAAAVMTIGTAVPAMADYVRLGSVDVGYHMDKDTAWSRFGGGMEGLRLTADGNDVTCSKIVAHFGDGSQQNVFSGKLREDRPVNVDLAGGTRKVRDVSFTCRSDERGGAKIYLSAEIGRYKNDWMKSPDWALFWSRLFNWGPVAQNNNGNDPNYWVTLGRESFEGRRDREQSFAGWNGKSVERIGLRAVNDDARCSRVRVTFGNGMTRDLDVGRLDRGRVKTVDLPGGNRNVTRLNMVCSAVNRNQVTVEILARK